MLPVRLLVPEALQALQGAALAAVETPSLVLDMDAVERNIVKMAHYAKERNLLLRPHAKLHKSSVLAHMQMKHGAVGLCCQKVSEAEALIANGIHNVFISNEVIDPRKLARVAENAKLVNNQPNGAMSICVDNVEGVHRLATAAKAAGCPRIGVFVEIEVGQMRCGCASGEAAVPIVKAIVDNASSGLTFAGVHAYHGSAQHIRSYEERKEVIGRTIAAAKATSECITATLGIAVPIVTGAGTGTFSIEANSGVYHELQPGSYTVMDRDYRDNTADPDHPDFEHAMFIRCQVISVSSDRVVLDAGHKAHAIDCGMPSVWGRPDLDVVNGGDEHTILQHLDADKPVQPLPQLGECVYLVPGHCDPTFNLHSFAIGFRGGANVSGPLNPDATVSDIIPIDARGCCW